LVRILLIAATVLTLAGCTQCQCPDSFCVYTLDGGGCGFAHADCWSGAPLCHTDEGALSGPVPDAGSECVYQPEKEPHCAI